ncbi:hypothetical protein [Aliikangiella coralliicola]|uniref:Uncharacterized protein n=1 Tax=Aliikangiella coralliicola TaxID=2592383 RepID=A0A545U083_9GAMM|nr:hypothetical protein [Aliikangiella coralliicola]TQV82875.1 hypothetical protein FLL46_24200 [Aliikangiella coralliicola]
MDEAESKLVLELLHELNKKQRVAREESLVNRHFGAIITAVVSIAAVIVSYVQIEVAKVNKSKELDVKRLESERLWKIEAAKFIGQHRETIFSEDDRQRQIMRHVISVAFPKEIGVTLLVRVKKAKSGDLLRRFWKPDGINVEKKNEEKLKAWLENSEISGPGSITMLLHAESFEDARVRAVTELNLEGRQSTMTNVPNEQLSEVKNSYLQEGAQVTARLQVNGTWTVTVTYPDSSDGVM